jgi:hypothetical protein
MRLKKYGSTLFPKLLSNLKYLFFPVIVRHIGILKQLFLKWIEPIPEILTVGKDFSIKMFKFRKSIFFAMPIFFKLHHSLKTICKTKTIELKIIFWLLVISEFFEKQFFSSQILVIFETFMYCC